MRALTKIADDASPALTRDGGSVLFVRQIGTGPSQILSVPWEGGEPKVVTEGLAVVASPVDDRIVYLAGEKPEVVVRRRDLVTGRDTRPSRRPCGTQAFEELAIAPDGVILVMSGERTILEVDLASGRGAADPPRGRGPRCAHLRRQERLCHPHALGRGALGGRHAVGDAVGPQRVRGRPTRRRQGPSSSTGGKSRRTSSSIASKGAMRAVDASS